MAKYKVTIQRKKKEKPKVFVVGKKEAHDMRKKALKQGYKVTVKLFI